MCCTDQKAPWGLMWFVIFTYVNKIDFTKPTCTYNTGLNWQSSSPQWGKHETDENRLSLQGRQNIFLCELLQTFWTNTVTQSSASFSSCLDFNHTLTQPAHQVTHRLTHLNCCFPSANGPAFLSLLPDVQAYVQCCIAICSRSDILVKH